MTLRLFAPLFILAAAAPPQETAGGGKIKVEAVGLHINKAPYLGDKDFARPMEPTPGTLVSVLVVLDEGGIIRLDSNKSKLAKFADDKGTDLLAAKPAGDSFNSGPIGAFPKISKDQKAILVDLQAAAAPAAGAKSLTLEGSLSFTVGKDQEAVKQEKVAARKDASFKVGGLEFKIKEAGKNEFGDDPMRISLESKDGLKVAKIRFFDSAGTEIESRLDSHGVMSMGDEATHSWDFALKKLVQTVTVEVAVWKKVTVVDVPLKLGVSAGL